MGSGYRNNIDFVDFEGSDKKFKVTIVYCGEGYKSKADFVTDYLVKVFPNAQVSATAIKGSSGTFKLTVNDSEVVYDKVQSII